MNSRKPKFILKMNFVIRQFILLLNIKILNTFKDLPSGYDYNPPKGYSADSNPTFPNHVKVLYKKWLIINSPLQYAKL